MQDLVALRTYVYPQLAHVDRAKLEDAGIECLLRDENVLIANPFLSNAVGGIKLMVHQRDVKKAKRILSTKGSFGVKKRSEDETKAEVVCPKCHSNKIERKISFLFAFLSVIFFFLPFVIQRRGYICQNCGHKWKTQAEDN